MVGNSLFYVPDHASYIFTRSIRGIKGSDASNIYDEEVNDEVTISFAPC
jgi:H/ACA ribonucleoprotein complex non-core subunit NAF1